MPHNMIVRVVADASDFIKGLKSVENQTQKTGKQVQASLSFQDIKSMKARLAEIQESYTNISQLTKDMDLSSPLSKQLNDALRAADRAEAKIEEISEKQRRISAAPVATTESAQKKRDYKIQTLDWDLHAESDKLDAAIAKVEKLKTVAASLGEVDWELASEEGIAALTQEYSNLQAKLGSVGIRVSEIGAEADSSSEKLSLFQRAGQAVGNAFNSMRTAVQVVRSCGDAAEDAEDDLSYMQRAALRAKAALSSIGSAAKGGLSWLASLPKKLGSGAWNGLKSLGNHLANIGKKAASSSAGMGKMLSSIKNISIASLALNVAHSIFGRLNRIVSEYISENETLKTQTETLKSSMGQSLAPAINLVTNAMSALMPYVVGISNAIGSLMTTLMGNGWATAADGAKKTAAATNGAAAAQEKMSKQLMGFDQINRMDGEKNSSGGGGGSATSAAAIEPRTPAWLDTYKKAFSDTFESLEFQSASVGKKIGMALNTAVVTTVGLLKDVDFGSIGQSLAGHFNDAVGAIDWSAAGQLIGIAMTSLPSVLVGFIVGADWAMVGQSLTEVLTSALTTVSEQINATDWIQVGLAVSTFIENTDWAAIAQSFGRLLGNAFGAIGTVILSSLQAPWESFKETLLNNIDRCGGDLVAGLLLSIVEGIAGIGNWLWENFAKPIIDGVREAFGIHSPSTVFAEIGEQLMKGLTGGISTGLEWVQAKLDALKQKALDAAEKLKTAFSFEWKLPSLKLPHLQLDWEPVDNVVAKFFGVTAFPHLSVSWFAKGGILDGAQIFGAMGSTLLGGGESGREAILPLDSNTGWMDNLARKVSSLVHSDGGAISATINIVLDGKSIASYVIKDLRSRARAGSISLG